MATVFVHFHNNKFKYLYKHKTAYIYSSRYSVSLRAKHSMGSRGKVPGQGLVVGRSPPEADHADDILQFNAQVCQASVT